jgi:deazaflavin-dependent oxidoreductase (nitroreductase family)
VQRLTALFTHHSARFRPLAAAFGRLHSAAFTRTGGRVGGGWLGAPVLVLVTTGRRSGKVRETPLIYVREGEGFALLAANAGNDRVPAWWLNLQASDTAEVVLGGRRRVMRWREVEGEEHARLFGAFVGAYPPTAHYATFTERHLPIAVLTEA